MQRIYLDSNVFISLFSKEIGRNMRGLFVEAEGFFKQVKQKNHILILSNLFFEEVQKQTYLSEDEITTYFKEQEVNFEISKIKPGLPWRKFVAKGVHYSDALHMAAAIAFKCNCIVTFNIKDFEKVKQEIKSVEPANFD